jgi:thiamine-phosphate pyrophosphorylase
MRSFFTGVCESFIVIDDNNTVAFTLPQIYPITDCDLSGLSHASQVARLIDGGASLIQLRDKSAPPKNFLQQAEDALAVARVSNVRLVINDRVDVAMAVGADGVHLGQSDFPAEVARRLLKPGSIIGVSTHDLNQLALTAKLPIDYVAFGPIFETETKRGHEKVVGLDGLRAARAIVGDLPLVAIGGITRDHVHAVLAAGADSVALISALVSNPAQIAEKMRQILAIAEK